MFVRTKIDLYVRNNKRAHPRTHREEAVVDKVMASILNDTSEPQNEAELFLIYSYATTVRHQQTRLEASQE